MERNFKNKTSLILYFLKGSKRYYLLTMIFACLVSLLELINPKIISYTVDYILTNNTVLPLYLENIINQFGGISWIRANLWVVACLVILVAILSCICRFLYRYLNTKGSEILVHNMRNSLFDHILHLPFSWHSINHSGDIIQRCTSDVEQIKTFLSDQLTLLFRFIILIVLALYFMFNINVKLTLAAAIFIPIIIGYSLFFHKGIANSFEKVDIEEGKLSSIAQENLTGVRVVRAFGKEAYERKRFEKQNASYTKMWVSLMNLLSAFWSSSDLFSYLQVLTVLVYGAILCINGAISAGEYIAFISYTSLLMWPIRILGRVIANLSKAGISIDRLLYIMNSELEKDNSNAIDVDMKQDIHFNNVSFSYNNTNNKVLDNVTFTIKHGTSVGILGATGCGKSTLMYLLDKLYQLDDNSGSITIGDTNISNIKTSCVRENIGMVLQEPYLFSRTLLENIGISLESLDQERINQCVKVSCLTNTIEHFNDGYNTFVGEKGVTLSGGQKQRTAIAQILVKNPPIMIFDDSLSAVDAQTDALIRKGLKENTKDSTVILIAQRITTIMDADLIIVMDKGKIVQSGTHQQLINSDGIYKQIYDLQSRNSMEVE